LRQRRGLLLHRFRRGSLLHQRRILLRHRIHRADRLIDFVDAGALLAAGRRDLADHVADLVHAGDNFIHRGAGIRHQLAAPLTFSTESPISALISLAAPNAGPDCAPRRHHGKATALLTGARRFHRRIQRQDVGLEGDTVDHRNDVDDLADDWLIESMVPTTCATTSPPLTATCAADAAS
jgi:hypothetical protein